MNFQGKIVILIMTLLIFGCKSNKGLSYEEFKELSSTHIIVNDSLKNSINTLVLDEKIFGDFDKDVLVLKVDKRHSQYEFCLAKTDFRIFKFYRPKFFKPLRGYLVYNDIPMLIFGDVDKSFFKKNDNKFYDVTGDFPKYDKNNPPIIYDLNIICFYENKDNN